MLIADFGLSKEESLMTSNSLLRGIPAYIDPQCHKKKGYKRFKASDIFSFGVLLWEISCGKVPFVGLSDFMIMSNLVNGVRERRVDFTPDEYFDLYTKCWDDVPEKRPNIEEIVRILEVALFVNQLPPLPTSPSTPSLPPPPQTPTTTTLTITDSCNDHMTGVSELNVDEPNDFVGGNEIDMEFNSDCEVTPVSLSDVSLSDLSELSEDELSSNTSLIYREIELAL
jgi:hypothetical protein